MQVDERKLARLEAKDLTAAEASELIAELAGAMPSVRIDLAETHKAPIAHVRGIEAAGRTPDLALVALAREIARLIRAQTADPEPSPEAA